VLREQRRRLAEERQVKPYIIFGDATLRELARVRPSNLEWMHLVYGIGEAKLRDFGPQFLRLIQDHCRRHGLTTDNPAGPLKAEAAPRAASRPNAQRDLAFKLFRQGAAIADVMRQVQRSRATVVDYLCEYIRERRPPGWPATPTSGWPPPRAGSARAGSSRCTWRWGSRCLTMTSAWCSPTWRQELQDDGMTG